MEDAGISKRIIDLIIKHIDAQKSDRDVAKKAKISNTSIGYFRAGASMKLDTMEKILNAYPELRGPIADILFGNSAEKHTAATNPLEAAVKSLADSVATLTQANLTANQTIAQLLSSKVVKQRQQ